MSSTVYIVSAEFDNQEDADAFLDLASELGVSVHITRTTTISKPRSWDTRLGRALLRSMQPNRTYDVEHFRIVCEEHEFAPASWSPMLCKLVEAGKVNRIGSGLYRLVSE